MGLNNKIKK